MVSKNLCRGYLLGVAITFLAFRAGAQVPRNDSLFLYSNKSASNFLAVSDAPSADNYLTAKSEILDERNSSEGSPDFNLFGNIGNNFLHTFKGNNLYLQLSAVAATALLVPTNVDYSVEHYFNTHPQYTGWSNAVNYTGQDLPFIVGGGLLAYAELEKNDRILGASFAVIQASLIGVVYNSFLKAITGRPGPRWQHYSNMEDLSETFRFGFLRGGMFWGWPSGHTVASMSVVSALTSYYPHSTWLKIVGYGLVGYTMAAVSAHNRGGMHWFSDAVAGALISYTIGSSVGSYFRSVYTGAEARTETSSSLSLSPTLYPVGLDLSYQF